MTDKLILTTAQRAGFIQALNGDGDTEVAIAMLQSLPMVQGEPVAYRQKRLLGKNKHWHYDAHEINPDYLHEFEPLYTSPQPLQTITADDVTDDMVRVMSYFHGYAPTDKEVIAAAYNAVIKHRSEARWN